MWALASAIAACGGGGQRVTVEATAAAMRHAADATASKGSSRFELTMTMEIRGQAPVITATGTVDPPHKRADMTYDMRALFAAAASSGSSVPTEASSLFSQPIEILLDGTVVYMHFPALAQLAGGGDKEWVKIDLAANKDLGVLLGDTGAGSDPTSMLEFLQGAGTVSEVGSEDVRGVATQHFSGSYTINAALDTLPDDRRDAVARAFASLGLPESAKDAAIPFDVWIDGDGLVRRVSFTFDMAALAPAGSATSPTGKVSLSMEFFDLGTSVEFDVPSDDQVIDASSLFQNTGSKFSTVASSIGN